MTRDNELLRRFAASRSEEAFAELVVLSPAQFAHLQQQQLVHRTDGQMTVHSKN